MSSSGAVSLKNLTVGYGGRAVVSQINIDFLRGKMTCILGSNGAGKTTMLKTIAGIIHEISGKVFILDQERNRIKSSVLANKLSVVLTNKIDIENLTGFEVAAMGRYPHIGFFCRLTENDIQTVEKYLKLCSAWNLKDKYFHEMSDGEKQKIMLARGLAQETDILMLDEPTSHLDIKHKLDLLHLLRKLCVEEGKTIICTLHEPDLAVKCCDNLVLVHEDQILASGTCEEIIEKEIFDQLYGFSQHQFNPYLGTIEFPNIEEKDVYIIGSDHNTPMLMRSLNKEFIGMGMGVLHQNDVSCHIASSMNVPVDTVAAYSPVTPSDVELAFQHAQEYREVLLCDFPVCSLNEQNLRLAELLAQNGKKVIPLAEADLHELVVQLSNKKRGKQR